MVSISLENNEQTNKRLQQLIPECQLTMYDEPYAFQEFGLENFPDHCVNESLAFIRDDNGWSQLVPCQDDSQELFFMFRFHFPQGKDNSGFVGWLASYFKNKLGTGVFVICGYNKEQGGIFDYWGCPYELRHQVVDELKMLMQTV